MQAFTEDRIAALAGKIAADVAKNAGTVVQLCYAPALFALQEALLPENGQALPDGHLKLILNGDPAWLLAHVKENSVFDADLLAEVFRLAKERASQLASPAGPAPDDIGDVRAKYNAKSAECDQLIVSLKGEPSPTVAQPATDEDGKRIDWLEANNQVVGYAPSGDWAVFANNAHGVAGTLTYGKTWRSAVDAARAAHNAYLAEKDAS